MTSNSSLTDPGSDVADPGTDIPAAPERAALAALDSDTWARVLTVAREALNTLEPPNDNAQVRQLRSSPTSRLVSGPMGKRLQAMIAAGGPLWESMVEIAGDAPDGPLAVLTGQAEAPTTNVTVVEGIPQAQHDAIVAERDRVKEKHRAALADRDEARKAADGAKGRLRTLRSELAAMEEQRDVALSERDGLQREVDIAAKDREKLIVREQRRSLPRVVDAIG